MSAPEDSTATAQPAPDHHHHHLHHHHHHQQNVVPAAATASVLSASSATVVAGATAVPTPTNTGPPTAATATLSVPAAPAADIVTGSGVSASTTLPAIKAGGNSSHATILTTTSHSKEVVGGTATNPAAQDGSNAAPGVAGPSDATDATSSCDSDKAPAAAAAAAVTSSPPGADEGVAAATSDSFASVEVGSTGGTSTPLAAASPASLTGGDIGGPKPLPLSGCGSLMVAGSSSSSIVVPNGEGGDSNPNVPVLSGTATTIPLRGRDVTDKHAVDYHYRMLEEELQAVKESEAKIKQQYSESQRRERILARRVAVQEQEMRDFSKQIAELKSAQAPGPAALRSALLDPAVNILFQKLKAELQATKAKLEETQNELSAWKFTPDSNTGKRLMAKCRLLYQENEELGKMTSNGRLAKLESELALQKSYNEEVKKSQLELDDFLQELDEDVEGMQGTIVFLQQELKQTKDARNEIEKEVIQLRAYIAANLGPFSGSGNNPTSGSTPTDERSSSMMMMMDVQDSNSNSNSHGHDAYHHPDGGGPDSIGGRGVRLGELGGGVTPIYLVNGGGGGGAGAGGASSSSGGTVIDAASRLVNKSSSSGDDQDLMVYSNRTHCGGVVTNSNELRTTPTTGAAGALPAAASVATAAAVSSLSALLPGSVPDPGIGGGGSSANSNTATVNGGAAGSGGEPLVNELHDSLVPSEGTRTSGGNTDSNSGGNVADTGNSVNSTNSSSSLAVAKQPHQPQQQPQQPQQQRTNNNVGRNGGRTTVAARKRNYNETEVDSAEQTDGGSGGGVVSSSDAYRSESGVDGVLVMDVGVAESSATSGVANGKLAIADGSLLPEQHQDVESSNSNKRMTRSGKGKTAAATASATTTISSSSTSSSSSSSSSSAASNVLMTSAAKKLRRGSIAPDDEVDPLADPQPSPQQQSQQPISSANGSN